MTQYFTHNRLHVYTNKLSAKQKFKADGTETYNSAELAEVTELQIVDYTCPR